MPSLILYRIRRLKRSMLAKLALFSPLFGPLLPAATPLVKLEYRSVTQSNALIIFLPGLGDLAEDFERRGVIDDMLRYGIAADAIAVDAHFGYYASEVVVERMTNDVIAAAHEAGYEEIWLAGISLGGFGAATYASHHALHIDGLLLLAPYLGSDTLIEEITEAGGINNWEPGPVRKGDHQRALWAWFKRHFAHGRGPQIYLGYGTSDKFARANALLANSLPQDHVFAVSGGHDWRTWKKIWQMFLEKWKTPIR